MVDVDQPEPESKEKTTKQRITIRVSLFFDGTNNNRTNIRVFEGKDEQKPFEDLRWYQRKDSYKKGRSNIALMETKVLCPTNDKTFTIKIYVEGPGTTDRGGDNPRGSLFGTGDTSVEAKVEKGIKAALSRIFLKVKPKRATTIIEKITIDLFGFSRGAACARNAVYELLKGDTPLLQLIREEEIEILDSAVEVNFVGIYDTVSSYGFRLSFASLRGDFFESDTDKLKLDSIKLAKKTVQLVAADEHRLNFSITNIVSASGNGTEYYLPGVHSDVGGSYNDSENEKFMINSGWPSDMKRDRKRLIAAGWYDKNELKEYITAYSVEMHTATLSCLIADRKNITNAYSRIPLKIMAEHARDNGIVIDIDLEFEANDKLQEVKENDDLLKLEKQIKQYVKSVSSSGPKDTWSNNDPLLKRVRHKHLHFSAKVETGFNPRFDDNGNRKRLEYDG